MLRRSLVLALLSLVLAVPAAAQSGRPVRIINPYPPGGSVDVVARVLAQAMTAASGANVIVDNRPGASGNIATELVARAAGDGTTLLAQTLPFVVNPSLFRTVPYDPVRDFQPVSLLGSSPSILVVHPSVPVKSLKELLDVARAQPGKLNYSSAGNGTNLHIPAELMKTLAKVDVVHVPYQGGGPAMTAVLSGEVQLSFLNIVPAVPQIQANAIRPIALTGAARSSSLPDVPTMAEAGLPGYEFSTWWAIFAPASTPPATVAALNQQIVQAMRSREVTERMSKEGAEVIAGSPEQLGGFIRSEVTKWAEVIKAAGIKVD
ncbi:MAG: tripartite tricarboxylate transporter substrate binding protein [Alphaproteobacteria bacterium]|nr:tripartite tricarboxylate transporter substrate binding protein [Alphaproteobacteria bacterium]